jgi:hypothetical protein
MFKKLTALTEYFIKLDVNAVLFTILSDKTFQEFILDLNRKNQLMEGINSLGVSLREYSPFTPTETVSYKGKTASKGAGNPVILLDTAEFYDSFSIDLSGNAINISADPTKDDDNLFSLYGKEIVGLTKDSIELLITSLRVKLLKEIKDNLPK